jgi:hypothetical protein
MRFANEGSRSDVPGWSLWLVAAVCFGPLLLIWMLGVLLVPVWVGLVIVQLVRPEQFAHESPEALWSPVSAIAYVVGGGIGLAGLLRVLTLPRERPKRHRVYTIGIVAVGLAALLAFVLPTLAGDFVELLRGENVAAFLVYVGLPLIGATWVLASSWRFLVASPDDDRRHPKNSRARDDGWRLDA